MVFSGLQRASAAIAAMTAVNSDANAVASVAANATATTAAAGKIRSGLTPTLAHINNLGVQGFHRQGRIKGDKFIPKEFLEQHDVFVECLGAALKEWLSYVVAAAGNGARTRGFLVNVKMKVSVDFASFIHCPHSVHRIDIVKNKTGFSTAIFFYKTVEKFKRRSVATLPTITVVVFVKVLAELHAAYNL